MTVSPSRGDILVSEKWRSSPPYILGQKCLLHVLPISTAMMGFGAMVRILFDKISVFSSSCSYCMSPFSMK